MTRTTGDRATVYRLHHLPGQEGTPYAKRTRCPNSGEPVAARTPRIVP